ncbi:hypothetical protein HanIR_Chr04g0189361 [Helianthus annuus]|nr:hypothetical protein HanIR_Chr04g0189361 [Helianthus annuus]
MMKNILLQATRIILQKPIHQFKHPTRTRFTFTHKPNFPQHNTFINNLSQCTLNLNQTLFILNLFPTQISYNKLHNKTIFFFLKLYIKVFNFKPF